MRFHVLIKNFGAASFSNKDSDDVCAAEALSLRAIRKSTRESAIPAPQSPLIMPLRDYDRVRLTKPNTDNDTELHAGSVGTVVQCLADGYEMEFPGVEGSFQVPRGYLEKI